MNQNDNVPAFNRDKFVRKLFVDLRNQAFAYKAKKESTSSDNMFIGPKPLMYDYFVQDE